MKSSSLNKTLYPKSFSCPYEISNIFGNIEFASQLQVHSPKVAATQEFNLDEILK